MASSPSQAAPVVDHVSPDADDLQYAVRAWDLDFRPMGRARDSSRLVQTVDSTALIAWTHLSPRVDQRGSSPAGMRTFAMLGRSGPEISWCGQPVDRHTLMSFGAQGEFESLSPAGFEVHTLSVDLDHLDDLAVQVGVGSVAQLGRSARAVALEPGQADRVRCGMERVTRKVMADPSSASSDGFADTLRRDLPASILEATLSCSQTSGEANATLRDRSLRRALEFVEAHAARAPRIAELCAAAEASERTLRYAFQERLGMSPKAYLQNVRLNGVRRELRGESDGSGRARIGDVANRWGFWHLGQFASDYRKLFGELPSETQRGRPTMVSVRSPSSAQRLL